MTADDGSRGGTLDEVLDAVTAIQGYFWTDHTGLLDQTDAVQRRLS